MKVKREDRMRVKDNRGTVNEHSKNLILMKKSLSFIFALNFQNSVVAASFVLTFVRQSKVSL